MSEEKMPLSFELKLVNDDTGEVIQMIETKDHNAIYQQLRHMIEFYEKHNLEEEVPF